MVKTSNSTEVLADDLQVIETIGKSGIVLDADFLFTAEFVRLGDDLLLRGAGGSETLLRGYFGQDPSPPLETAEGARLLPETVEALAAPEAAQGYAQAGAAQLGQPIGEVRLLNGTARLQRPDGSRADLHEGDPIFQGDVVSTGVGSELGIVFIDETIFSLSANARMIINELIYNPGSTVNSMGVSLIQGTFVFVTGQVAPSGGLQVDTPVGTIGIRGTTVGVEIATFGGRTTIANLTNPETGETGSFVFSNNGGAALFSLANHYLEIRSANADPGVPRVASSQDILSNFGRALSRAVDLQRSLTRDQDQDDETDPADQQEGELEGDLLQDLQEAGLTPEQIGAFLNEPVIETAAGPDDIQSGDGGTSLPSSGSGFGGSLQTEAVANTGDVNGATGGSIGGASSDPLPPTGSAGTPPPPPGGTPTNTRDDSPPPPPPPPATNTPPSLTVGGAAGAEGDLVPLGAANLLASDAETADPAQLVYTVTGTTNGLVVLIVGESIQVVLSFTQADVNAGRVFFAHDGNEATQASVTLTVSDPNGGASAAKVLQIGIAPVNDAPLLINNSLNVSEGQTVVLSATDLSASDVDNPAPGLVFTVSGVTGGQFELLASPGVAVASFTQAQVTGGQVVFVDDGDNTPPSYSVSVEDGQLSTAPAPASISFTTPNDAPDAVDDALATGDDAVLNGNVLTDNGEGADSDPNDDLLTVAAVNGSAVAVGSQIVLNSGALLTLNADGTFSYDPNGAFDFLAVGDSDTDSFTYTISDGNGGSDSATVTITVTGANDAPAVFAAPASVAPGNTVFISTSILSASDPDHGDPADITFAVSNLVDGEMQIAGATTASFTLADVIAGLVTFVHDGGDNGTAGFSVIASDPLGGSSALTPVNFTVASGFVWTAAAGSGDWDDPANWLENAVPLAGSNVTIPNVGLATFSTGNLLLDSLHLAGGTLQVTGGTLETAVVDGESGTLLVDGGQFGVVAALDPTLAIGSDAGSLGNVTVENGGAINIIGNEAVLAVGRDGVGNTPVAILTISSGGEIVLDGQTGSATAYVGGTAEGLGVVFVAGQGSTLSVEGSAAGIVVADAGFGELIINDGGLASALYMEVGRVAESVGVVVVGAEGDSIGNRSELSIAGEFTEGGGAFVLVGGGGTGALHVTGGGLMSIISAGADPRLVIGADTGGSGSVVVSGAGSELILDNGGNVSPGNQPFIAIGVEGDGTLAVIDGGQVGNAANGYTFVGLQPDGTGSVVVGGDSVEGSLFDAGAVLVIGAGYNFPSNQILFDAGGTGSVIVGAGGTLTAGVAEGDSITDIFIGSGGSLFIQNGGTVIGDIENNGGSIFNGNSPGTVSFGGDFAMSGGVMEVELGGLEAGAFDLYQIAGAAALDGGTLEFSMIDGYDPVAGDFFAFLTAGGGLGADPSMLSFVFRGVGVGFDFAVDFTGDSIGVTVLSDAGAGDSIVFLGGSDADSFVGGDGADRLEGGAGADTLTGGAGADLFVLREAGAAATVDFADLITDFEVGVDRLGLADGLTAGDLVIGATAGGDAAVMVQSSGACLAVLQGVTASGLTLEEIAAVA